MRMLLVTISLGLLVACTDAQNFLAENSQRVSHFLSDVDDGLGKVPDPQKGIPRYVPSELPSGHNLL